MNFDIFVGEQTEEMVKDRIRDDIQKVIDLCKVFNERDDALILIELQARLTRKVEQTFKKKEGI